MPKIITTFLWFCSFHTALLSQNPYETLQADSLQIGAYSRSFLFHKPANVSHKPKLVFVLHGSNSSGQRMTQFTEHWFSRLADERGDVIVVYPNGYKNHWNECRKEANFEANLLNIDDNTFFEKMIDIYFLIKSFNSRLSAGLLGFPPSSKHADCKG